jgi:roadblock/LC7 domain-containing protein
METLKKIFSKEHMNGFFVGLIFGGIIAIACFIITDKKPTYSDSVKWVINNPNYAESVKKNHDVFMNAAEDAFKKTLENQTEVSK